jgi:serine protease
VPSTSAWGTGYTRNFSGTSSAAPHVSGVAALLLSLSPDLTVARLTEALEAAAVAVGAKYNNLCGGGRVDALAALDYVRSGTRNSVQP